MNEFNYNTLKTVLPFYPSLDHQNRNKSWCKDEMRGFSLISPNNRFLPFQLVRTSDPATSYTWELYSAVDDSLYQTINFPPGQIDTSTVNNLDYITYFGTDVFFSAMDCGRFYIKWTDGTNTKYSEVFTIKDFTDDTFLIYRKYGTDTELRIIDITEEKRITV